jgi:hypothetical protein
MFALMSFQLGADAMHLQFAGVARQLVLQQRPIEFEHQVHMRLGLGNRRHAAAVFHHRAHSGVPRGKRHVDAAEAVHQARQQPRAGVDVVRGVEQALGLFGARLGCGADRHDLHQPDRAARRHRVGLEAGLDRDDGLEQLDVHTVRPGGMAQHGLQRLHLRREVQPGEQAAGCIGLAGHTRLTGGGVA